MRIASKAASIGLATIGLFVTATASAHYVTDVAPSRSIEACVAEIGGHADYTDASRVRHELETTQRRSLAYKLKFSTKVYGESGDEVIREYATKCVVYGDDKPVFFEIEETL